MTRLLLDPRFQIGPTALRMVKPLVAQVLASGVTRRNALAMVGFYIPPPAELGGDGLEFEGDCILFRDAITVDQWTADYMAIALSKGKISWETGFDSDIIQIRYPHLLNADDTQYWGSRAIPGMGVSCSGVEPYFDRMFASWYLEAMIALSANARASLLTGDPPPDFLDGRSTR